MPQQDNTNDCGVFTVNFIEHRARGEESFGFTQNDMNFLRRRMTWELLKGKFLTGAVLKRIM